MKKYILGTVLFFSILVVPLSQVHAAGLTTQQATTLIQVVQASPGTPASAFVSLITAFSNLSTAQASSLITVVQASPSTPASVFVPLITSFTDNSPTQSANNTSNNTSSALSVDLKVNNSDGPLTLTDNQRVTLTWTSNGTSCYITNIRPTSGAGVQSTENLSPNGSREVYSAISSGNNGIITLSCRSADYTQSRTDEVRTSLSSTAGTSASATAPSINSFTASPSTVAYDRPTSLSWSITPSGTGTTCSLSETTPTARPIYNNNLLFSSSGTGTYNLTANTTYRIDCRNNEGGASSRSLSIAVNTPTVLAITSVSPSPVSGTTATFTINGSNFQSGATVSYSGNSAGNYNASFSASFVSSSQLSVTGTGLAQGSSYMLFVRNPNGQTSSGCSTYTSCNSTLSVAQAGTSASATAPSINSFTASPSTVAYDRPTSLSWSITPSGTGTTCSLSETTPTARPIYNNNLLFSSSGTGTYNLTANTTYRIDCRNNEGGASSRSLSIAVTASIACGDINGLTNLTTTSWANYKFCSNDTATGVYPSSLVRPSTTNGIGQYTWTCGTNSCSASISSVAMISGTNQTASALNAFGSTTQSPSIMQGTTEGFSYTFTQDMYRGVQGSEVVALQRALHAEGLFAGEATGNFYDVTREAVIAFQIRYGINPTGYVGFETRAKLNVLY